MARRQAPPDGARCPLAGPPLGGGDSARGTLLRPPPPAAAPAPEPGPSGSGPLPGLWERRRRGGPRARNEPRYRRWISPAVRQPIPIRGRGHGDGAARRPGRTPAGRRLGTSRAVAAARALLRLCRGRRPVKGLATAWLRPDIGLDVAAADTAGAGVGDCLDPQSPVWTRGGPATSCTLSRRAASARPRRLSLRRRCLPDPWGTRGQRWPGTQGRPRSRRDSERAERDVHGRVTGDSCRSGSGIVGRSRRGQASGSSALSHVSLAPNSSGSG